MRLHRGRTATLQTLLLVSCCSLAPLGAGAHAQSPTAAEAAPQAAWQPVGPPVLVERSNFSPEPALVTGPEGSLTLTFGSDAVEVWRWRDLAATWEPLGLPIAGSNPALAQGTAGETYVCSTSPFRVHRWDGAAWLPVGGDLDEETGWKWLDRTWTDRCTGLGVSRDGLPVLSFTTHEGVKLAAIRAARYSASEHAWRALPSEPIWQGRSVGNRLVVDEHGSVYMAAASAGEHGGRADVRALRLRDADWEPLGPDFHDASSPTLRIVAGIPHLALAGRDGAILVWQLGEDGWVALPSPGPGALPALAVDAKQRLLLAYARRADTTGGIQLMVLESGAWRPLSVFGDPQTPSVLRSFGLVVDDHERAVIVATRQLPSGSFQVVVRRLPLP